MYIILKPKETAKTLDLPKIRIDNLDSLYDIIEYYNLKQDIIETSFNDAFKNKFAENYHVYFYHNEYPTRLTLVYNGFDDLDSYIIVCENFDNLEELYNSIDDKSDFTLSEYYEFSEETIKMLFDDPMEAIRATYFGNIQSWNDPYIRLNAYNNLESAHRLPYDNEASELVTKYIDETLLAIYYDEETHEFEIT